jgi:NDP-hexose 4-ketoreductase
VTHVLLFGASGFIGRHVRLALEQHPRSARVTCLRRDECDLLVTDVEGLAAALRELVPDVVVNCTGRLDGTAPELIGANTLGAAKLIEAAAAVEPSIRFIRLGSAGEYGRVVRGRPVVEDDPAEPVSEYGVSQLTATRLLDLATTAGRVDGMTLRVFNPIGPGLPDQTLLGRAASRLRDAMVDHVGAITLGPLSSSRDFVDVRDVAAAVAGAAFAPRPSASLINVGSGRAVTAREAVRLLAEAAGFAGEVREEDPPQVRSAGVDWICADITRASEALAWQPTYELADSIKAIWADTGAPGSVAHRSG